MSEHLAVQDVTRRDRDLSAGAPVEVPIELAQNHVYVPVTVGDMPLWFVLDTGAGYTLLDLSRAKGRPGVTLGPTFEIRGGGAGSTEGAQLSGVSLRLRHDSDSPPLPVVMAMDLASLSASAGRRMDGILGFDFISRYVIELDYGAACMRLHAPATFRYSGPGARIPIRMVLNHPHVDAELEFADGGRVKGDFVIDVGSRRAVALCRPLVDREGLRSRVGPTVYRPAGTGVGGEVWADVGRATRLRIGDATVEQPTVHLFGDSSGVFSTSQYFEGNIGGEVLRTFRVFLDYPRSAIILEPRDHADLFEIDMSGTTYVWEAKARGMRVTHVLPNSAAADAGMQIDDVIVRVDDREAEDVGITTLDALFRRDATTVGLTVVRDLEQRDVSIRLRRLV